jgi:DUF438 domain-containing protein
LAEIQRKEAIKRIIEKLHQGVPFEDVQREFRAVAASAAPEEIAKVEEELIKEGMPREEIQRLCDVHLAMFKDALEQEKPLAPPGHPIHILMEEHRILTDVAGSLRVLAETVAKSGKVSPGAPEAARLRHLVEQLRNSENHYLREENVLFPYLEKHGITEPPKIMWTEHDQRRAMEKEIRALVDALGPVAAASALEDLRKLSAALAEHLATHFYKENNILFPTGLRVLEASEWPQMRRQFDEIGYCPFTPPAALTVFMAAPETGKIDVAPGLIPLDTGTLSFEEVEAILNGLPVDVTLVGKDDTVHYFSASPERIFVRTKAVIGRTVQQCHPQKSLHVVNQILADFKSGHRKTAEFWINLEGKVIHIRYFALRDRRGEYLGCLEVSQDITAIQKLRGEKRLLD